MESTPLPNIGRPAGNALNHIGITTLEEVSKLDEKTLLKIHGVGPKAVKILKAEMDQKKLEFQNPEPLAFNPGFAVFGDLKCDNAPKRRVIRDFIIARTAVNKSQLKELITEDFEYETVNGKTVQGVEEFIDSMTTGEPTISSLVIETNLSHGKAGASDSVITLNSGSRIHTADFYTFENHKKDAKLKAVKSYIIE